MTDCFLLIFAVVVEGGAAVVVAAGGRGVRGGVRRGRTVAENGRHLEMRLALFPVGGSTAHTLRPEFAVAQTVEYFRAELEI